MTMQRVQPAFFQAHNANPATKANQSHESEGVQGWQGRQGIILLTILSQHKWLWWHCWPLQLLQTQWAWHLQQSHQSRQLRWQGVHQTWFHLWSTGWHFCRLGTHHMVVPIYTELPHQLGFFHQETRFAIFLPICAKSIINRSIVRLVFSVHVCTRWTKKCNHVAYNCIFYCHSTICPHQRCQLNRKTQLLSAAKSSPSTGGDLAGGPKGVALACGGVRLRQSFCPAVIFEF